MVLNASVSPARQRRTSAVSSPSWWTYTAASEKLAASWWGRRRPDVIVREGGMGSRREQSSVAVRSMTWDLRFTSNNSNGICVLNVAGRLGGANAPDLEAALDDATNKAGHRLVLDLSG